MKGRRKRRHKTKPGWKADPYLKFLAERCNRVDQSLPGYPGRRANWGWLAWVRVLPGEAPQFRRFAVRSQLQSEFQCCLHETLGLGLGIEGTKKRSKEALTNPTKAVGCTIDAGKDGLTEILV